MPVVSFGRREQWCFISEAEWASGVQIWEITLPKPPSA